MAGDLSSLKIDDSSRPRSSAGKRFGIFAAVLGVLLLIGSAALALRGKTPAVDVAAARAAGDPREATLLNASGYVTPRRRATVAAKITGRVTALYAEEGMHVSEGQVLALLDASDADVQLRSAQADREASAASL